MDGNVDELGRTARRPQRAAGWGAWLALLVALGLGGGDVLLPGRDITMLGLLAAVPFLAAALSTITLTVLAGVVAFGVAAGVGHYDHLWWTRDLDILLIGVAAATVVASVTAALRGRRLRQLQHSRHVADVVQQTLLRPVPAQVDDVIIATHYSSATSGAHVGGDLYDLQQTQYGVRLIVGDVRGKGLPAVRLASVTLSAFREWCYHEGALVGLASRIDVSVTRHAEAEEFVTAVLVELGPDYIDVVNCGHQPPLLVDEGSVAMIEPSPASLPLGLGATPVVRRLPFGAGTRLLLYTDGVTDARRRKRSFDLAAEIGRVSDDDAQVTVNRLYRRLRKFTRGRLNDDVAILLLERTGARQDENERISFFTPVQG